MTAHHPSRTLMREAEGEVRLVTDEASGWRMKREGDSWRVDVDDPGGGWVLRPARSRGSRWVLVSAADDRELGRTLALDSSGHPEEMRYFLMGDGRLFRFALRGPRDCRFELTGRETPGAFLTARPRKDGWHIEANPASGGIEDMRALTILVAAEILDAEEPTGPGRPLRA